MRTLASVAAVLLVWLIAATFWRRGRRERQERSRASVWKRAHHLGSELVAGRNIEANASGLGRLLDETDQPVLVASAVAVAIRREAHEVDPAVYRAVNRSALSKRLAPVLQQADARRRVEVLEIVEVLRLDQLLGESALLTHHDDPSVVRAACDAVVAIDPAVGLGILIGLADSQSSWVIDSIGRAAAACAAAGHTTLPIARSRWRSSPLLAQRAVRESALFDPATVADALSALVAALEDRDAGRRLAAVNALAGTIDDHPAAQLALAGALGSADRMVRFATAAALAETATGQAILRSTADLGDGSDAARMAAQLLWSQDARRREIVVPVA